MKVKVAVNVIPLFINITSVNNFLIVILPTVRCFRNVIICQRNVFPCAITINQSLKGEENDGCFEELSHLNELSFGNEKLDVSTECAAVTSVSDENVCDSKDNDFKISNFGKRKAQCVHSVL